MRIDGKTAVCGLIGNPVEHTLSPLIHHLLADRLGLSLAYVPFLVEKDVKKAVEGAFHLHIQGLNVTVPYKAQVMEALVSVDGLAEGIGAVNTLVREAEGYKGYNTDISGLHRALASEGIGLAGEKVVLLGAGGAARAVAFLCMSRGAERVFCLNRSMERGKRLAGEVNAFFGREGIQALPLSDYGQLPAEKMLCIQATSVGLSYGREEAVMTQEDFYRRIHTGYDLIYRPARTRFMELVRAQGGRAFHGLKMLLYQGVEAFELWNGTAVSEGLAEEVYERLKEELGIEE